jgi:hypothetical protein
MDWQMETQVSTHRDMGKTATDISKTIALVQMSYTHETKVGIRKYPSVGSHGLHNCLVLGYSLLQAFAKSPSPVYPLLLLSSTASDGGIVYARRKEKAHNLSNSTRAG